MKRLYVSKINALSPKILLWLYIPLFLVLLVNSDGSIVSKGDDNSHGYTNQGRFEVLQLNSVPTTEGNPPNQLQPSYIIHSMQSTSIAGQTYIIQQPTLVDNGTVQAEQVESRKTPIFLLRCPAIKRILHRNICRATWAQFFAAILSQIKIGRVDSVEIHVDFITTARRFIAQKFEDVKFARIPPQNRRKIRGSCKRVTIQIK